MKIEKGKVVALEYTLTVDEDTLIEDSINAGPLRWIQGMGETVGVPHALEVEVEGLEVGESKDVTVRADDFFPANKMPTKEMARAELPADAKVGSSYAAKTPEGAEVSFVVEKMDGDGVIVRFVHPLIGKDLNFAIKVLAVRDATATETQQGAPMAPPRPKS